jgi:hypothetical protein
MFLVGDKKVPLCLECNLKLVQMTQIQNDMLERTINYMSDHVDYTVGLPSSGPRYPERKTVNVGGVTLHNISVNNSTVGVINSGSIGTIDTALTVIKQSGETQLAAALKGLSEAIIASNEIQTETKNQMLEILSVLSTEATAPKERRHSTVVGALIAKFRELVGLTKDLSALWSQWGPIITSALG